MGYGDRVEFSILEGKIITKIEGMENGSDEVLFETQEGNKYKMYHQSDCCESVSLYDVIGHQEDLLNSPLTMSEVESNNENPKDYPKPKYQDSFTWTFYKMATVKGYVTLRWLGESNGYYSESVDFELVTP